MQNINMLNIVVRSYTKVNDLIFPLKIDIKNINYSDLSEEIFYKVDFISNKNGEYVYNVDTVNNKFEEELEFIRLKNDILYIYKFIDFDIQDYQGKTVFDYLNIIYKNKYNLNTEEGFVNFLLNEPIFDKKIIERILYEINFLIIKVKNMFYERAIKYIDLERNMTPIKIKGFQTHVPANIYAEIIYPKSMIELQPVFEYPTQILFPENVGKSFAEWSWREVELKKMYLTMKSKIDSQKESIKAQEIEMQRDADSNNKKRGR